MSSKKIMLITALIIAIAYFPAVAQSGCTCDAGCGSVSTISTDFTYDGSGEFCWFIPCIGDYLNCWNLTRLTINGQDYTNRWVSGSSLPSPIDGGYYIYYQGNYDWSHVEMRGACSVPGPTETPVMTTPTPVTDTPQPGVGDVSMSPSSISAEVGAPVSFQIRVNSGNQEVAAYGIDITYDAAILSIGSDEDVVEGADGFVSAVNINDPGIIKTSGFDTGGTGPGSNLHLLTVNMTAVGSGTSAIGISVDSLADPDTNTIGSPNGIGGSVVVGGTPTPTPTPVEDTPTPTPAQQAEIVFAVNCGGSAYTSSDGTNFVADTGYSGGTTYSNNKSISGTTDDTLYQSERYGNCTYSTNVANGDYLVTLYFAETYHTSAGSRSFDVLIEGTAVITNLDIYAEVGGNAAYVSEADVTVNDGVLNIQFVTNLENAKINAIKVSSMGGEITPSPTPDPDVGNVSMLPSSISAEVGDPVSFEIRVNSGNQRVAAYGIDITYDAAVLSIGSDEDVAEGADGFVSAVNINDPGLIRTSGFDTSGTGPGSNLHLLTVNMSAVGSGTSAIGISVDSLADPDTNTIGIPNGIGGSVEVSGTPTPTPTPIDDTPTPTPTPQQEGVGDVSMSPSSISAEVGDPVSFEIRVNSGDQRIAAYGIDITYDAAVLSIGSDEDVVEGADGFVSAVNVNDPGIIKTSGFDTGGTGPGSNLHLLTVNMTAVGSGTSAIGISVNSLADPDTNTIGSPNGIDGSVVIGGTPTPTPTPVEDTPTPTPVQQAEIVFAVNCGGSAYTSSDGTNFVADTGYSGGTTYSNNKSISGTTDDTLYQSERYGNCTYSTNVANGDYLVTLYFAETYHTSAGSRSFDVLIEGTAVITNLDIYAQVGGNAAYVSEANVTVSDGVINIQFVTKLENAKINAIKVSTVGGEVTPTPTPVEETPTPTPQQEGVGNVSMLPSSISAEVGDPVSFEIRVNSGDQQVAAYGIDITYDAAVLSIGSDEDVEEGADGFVSAVNVNDPGIIKTSGFDTGGTGPGSNLHLLTVNMTAIGSGTSAIGISVDSLADPDTNTIGIPNGQGGLITINDIPTATPTPVVTETPTPVVTETPTPVVTETPAPTPVQKTAGSVWIDPETQSVSNGSNVTFEVHCHSGNQELAAYGIDIYYDDGILSIASGNDVEEGSDGFIAAVNIGTAGKIVTSGFDTGGVGPGSDLHLLTITMSASGRGTSSLDLDVRSFVDTDTSTIGNPNGISGSVTVN